MASTRTTVAAGLLAALFTAACATAPAADAPPGPRTVQAGAPGEATRPVGAHQDLAGPSHTPADVRFMRQMIAHHAQALEMSALAPERSSHDQVRLLARRIAMGQADEMALMEQWLRARGEAVEDPAEAHRHHDHEAPHPMPGMLTAPQMARLAAASGAEFDRLFLEAMIFHHEGALAMVEELFATPGAGEEAEVYQFASHVDGDQRIEIARMYRLLNSLITP
jgi:uncharacterized protein (DUF305 family)